MTGPRSLADLTPDKQSKLPYLYQRLILIHHGLWFTQTQEHLSLEAALEAESLVWERINPRIQQRLTPHLRLILTQEVPTSADNAPDSQQQLRSLCVDLAKVWLALDGIWFQAVERMNDMETAMTCNEAAWHSFAFTEARRIRSWLDLDPHSGLEGLRQALDYRLYTWLNRHSSLIIDELTLEFEMNECRVQTARKRRGLADYPCQQAGLIEYSRFAQAIDPRFNTECLGCPPDPHPQDWYCKWRFHIGE